MRFELKPFNIDVIVIEPGLIDTGFANVVSTTIPPESVNGPYRELVGALTSGAENGMIVSPPSVIANTICRAIKSDRPRTRYAVGAMTLVALTSRLRNKDF